MSKADNVGKAARSNTTAAARKQYSKTGKATAKAARAKKGEVLPAAAPAPLTGKAAAKAAKAAQPDYPPPAAVDHSAQATDTPPPAIDKKGQRVE